MKGKKLVDPTSNSFLPRDCCSSSSLHSPEDPLSPHERMLDDDSDDETVVDEKEENELEEEGK